MTIEELTEKVKQANETVAEAFQTTGDARIDLRIKAEEMAGSIQHAGLTVEWSTAYSEYIIRAA